MLTPLQHRAQNLTPGLGVSRESPQCADEGAEELRGEVVDPRSPSLDEAVSPRPHAGPGVRVEGARISGQGGRREGRAPSRVPQPDSCAEGAELERPARPARLQVRVSQSAPGAGDGRSPDFGG